MAARTGELPGKFRVCLETHDSLTPCILLTSGPWQMLVLVYTEYGRSVQILNKEIQFWTGRRYVRDVEMLKFKSERVSMEAGLHIALGISQIRYIVNVAHISPRNQTTTCASERLECRREDRPGL